MKYIKSFADTSTMNEFVENTTENGYYLLRDESAVGIPRINYVNINVRPEFCVVALENSSVGFVKTYQAQVTTMQYSIDDGATWQIYNKSDSIQITKGNKVYFKAVGTSTTIPKEYIGGFFAEGRVHIKGDLLSLVASDFETMDTDLSKISGSGNFFIWEWGQMFKDVAAIASAKGLLIRGNHTSYRKLFENCTNLTHGPIIDCGVGTSNMFQLTFLGCSSLIDGGEIRDVALTQEGVFYSTYYNCSNMNTVKCYITNPSDEAMPYWLTGVAANGTFYKKTGVTWPTGDAAIPSGWTVVEE